MSIGKPTNTKQAELEQADWYNLADVRDGLTRTERVILYCLHQAQQELGQRNVPTAMLYGRVLEFVDMSQQEFQTILSRFISPR